MKEGFDGMKGKTGMIREQPGKLLHHIDFIYEIID